MKVNVICQWCGKIFSVYASRIERGGGKFCSQQCYSEYLREAKKGEKNPSWKEKKKCICAQCKKEFFVNQWEINKGRKFCSRECYAIYRSKHYKREKAPAWKGGKIKCICKECGREFYVDPNVKKKGRGIFCSRSCQGKYIASHWLTPMNIRKKNKRIRKICKECGKEFLVPPSQKDHVFCSRECYYKWCKENRKPMMAEATCDYCGRIFLRDRNRLRDQKRRGQHVFCSEECRKKWQSEFQKELWKNPEIARKRRRKHIPNNFELRGIRIIQNYQLPYKFVGDGKVSINGLCPDFIATDGKKKIIEFFGEPYHEPKNTWLENIPWGNQEFGRKALFSQLGYDTLILWYSEIKNMSDAEVADIIKKFHEK